MLRLWGLTWLPVVVASVGLSLGLVAKMVLHSIYVYLAFFLTVIIMLFSSNLPPPCNLAPDTNNKSSPIMTLRPLLAGIYLVDSFIAC